MGGYRHTPRKQRFFMTQRSQLDWVIVFSNYSKANNILERVGGWRRQTGDLGCFGETHISNPGPQFAFELLTQPLSQPPGPSRARKRYHSTALDPCEPLPQPEHDSSPPTLRIPHSTEPTSSFSSPEISQISDFSRNFPILRKSENFEFF